MLPSFNVHNIMVYLHRVTPGPGPGPGRGLGLGPMVCILHVSDLDLKCLGSDQMLNFFVLLSLIVKK